MSTLSIALAWAARGRAVLPLLGKVPPKVYGLLEHGACDASTDPVRIQQWWRQWPGANLGLTLADWCVVDVDQRHEGMARWTELCAEHGEPVTLTQLTGSGGLHYCFQGIEFEVRGKLCDGVDILTGAHRYIVAAPSVHPCGGTYRWTRRMVPQAMPSWLVELCRREDGEPVPPSPLPTRDRSTALVRAEKYAAQFEPAVSGSNGHQTAFRACLLLVSRFPELAYDDYMSVLVPWNRRCLPPWSRAELAHKVSDAMRRVNGEVAA